MNTHPSMRSSRFAGRCSRLAVPVLVLLAAVPTLLPSPLAAQNSLVGLRGGVTVSDFRGGSWDSDVGGTLGGFLNFPVLAPFSGAVDVSWTSRGATTPPFVGSRVAEALGRSDTHTFELAYLEFALLARYTVPEFTVLEGAITAFAGPAVSFLTSCQWRVRTFEAGAMVGENKVDCSDLGSSGAQVMGAAIGNVDTSGLLGLELKWKVGPGAFLLDTRYNLGLQEVDPGIGRKNQAWSMVLGVGWNLP